MYQEIIGTTLKEIRKGKKLTVKYLTNGLISPQHYYKVEWNGNSFFDKFYKVQNFFPYAIPIVLDNEPPRM